MNTFKQHAARFKALGDPNRLLILSLLQRQDGTMSVDELLDKLTTAGCDFEQPTLSYHLKAMRKAGIVDYAGHGLRHYYAICPGVGSELADIVESYTRNESAS